MELDIKFDAEKTILKFNNLVDKSPELLVKAIQRSILYLRGRVDKNLATGKWGIKTKGGALRASLATFIYASGQSVQGIVGTNLVYSRIQEVGGDIYPKQARCLVFQIGGRTVFARKVTIPAHWYMRNTLDEESQSGALAKQFNDVYGEELKK